MAEKTAREILLSFYEEVAEITFASIGRIPQPIWNQLYDASVKVWPLLKGDKTMMEKQGAFEQLTEAIEKLLPAEGGWHLADGELVIHTKVSRDSSRNRNGGEYDLYTCFEPVGDGVLVYRDTSCELYIDWVGKKAGYVIPCIVGIEGLRRIASSVGLRATCEKFLKKQATFSQLREAVQATVPAEAQ